MLDQLIFQITLFILAIIFIPALIIVFIEWLVTGEITCYDDDDYDTSPKESDTDSWYTHTDNYGRISGVSHISGNDADHYSDDGYGISFQSESDAFHIGTKGYLGRSYTSDDGEITHYDQDNRICGYSRPMIKRTWKSL